MGMGHRDEENWATVRTMRKFVGWSMLVIFGLISAYPVYSVYGLKTTMLGLGVSVVGVVWIVMACVLIGDSKNE